MCDALFAKFPRFTKGPLCYSLQEWCIRLSISQLTIFIMLASLFIWLDTRVDPTTEGASASRGFLISSAAICFIPIIFSIILLIGIWNESTKLLMAWVWYGLVGSAIITILFLAIGFWYMSIEVGSGVLMVGIGIVLGGYLFYSVLLVHSLNQCYKEKNTPTENELHNEPDNV